MTVPGERQQSVHNVVIDAQPGHANISVDDAEVGNYVVGYTLEHDVANALPLLVMHVRHPAGTIFDGLARVAVAAPQEPGEAIAQFLSSIEPRALEMAALNRDDLQNERYDLTRAMLAQLADWALGRP
ncbi:hypothetical protein [Streptomyces sp. ME19-01-6]|uniref:hypothetical protein n=1 Tax=Streptomyces sp. ME19-01-6 TaxID=3028686 RepID=UPI0029BED924|nr:hypothetical protein [Streptomyces sp. ME19-01-6]MDX3232887.1 hypothetical protein [Streptomyces sp. ME19-01-6]